MLIKIKKLCLVKVLKSPRGMVVIAKVRIIPRVLKRPRKMAI